jgi:tryptophan synthase alpha chain
MNRIQTAFQTTPIFMPYFPVGYPDIPTSIDILEALATPALAGGARAIGADLIEVGMSFSDPLADGPVIQKATQTALEQGVTTKDVIAAVAELRKRGVDIPLILMGYYNPILAYGLEKFIHDATAAGADGFIIPDLPPEESAEFVGAIRESHQRPNESSLPLITMLAPTTSDERMEQIARNAQGFIYLVSVTGVTGTRRDITVGLGELIKRVRQHTDVPVCVGFGISTPEQARQVGEIADGVIVGSACVREIGESENPVETAKQFAGRFREALRKTS